MKLKQLQKIRGLVLLALLGILTGLSNQIKADTGTCGGVTITLPFNDVMASPFFCQIASAYYSGLTNGTTATTYSPTEAVTREQMAAFISRTLDQSLKRGSDRAVTKKWWTPQTEGSVALTDVGGSPLLLEFDGTDLWVPSNSTATVKRVRPGDGKVLESWTAAGSANAVLCAMGKVFITAKAPQGILYMIDPTQPAGAVTTLTTSLGGFADGIAFDGSRIWTANNVGSVSIISLNPTTVTTTSTGFDSLVGILYDGSNIWVTDNGADTLLKLNANGTIAQTINMPHLPRYPVFDGTNIWVPAGPNSISVVRVKDAQGNPLANAFVVATLTGNGMSTPISAAFDGERILVTNQTGHNVSLWKAADLTPLGSFPIGLNTQPYGACSDGLNFWLTLAGANSLARF